MKALLLIFLFQFAQAHPTIEVPDAAPEACKKFIDTLPKTWSGGYIRVPRDWSQEISESNPAVNVFFYFENTRDLEASQPILFFKGGPFGHAQANVKAFDELMQKYDPEKRHTFIVIDQRGTGCSFPLVRNPLPQTEAELAKIDLDIIRMYSTDDIVKDSEYLRKTVFKGKKWKIFGQSFGGTIVQRYVYDHPEALVSAQAHAPTVHSSWTEFARHRLIAQQFVLKQFIEHYQPENSAEVNPMQKAIDILHSEAGKEICLPEKGLAPKLCGAPLMDAVLSEIGQGPSTVGPFERYDNWDAISKKLMLVIAGDLEGFKKEADKSVDSFFRNDRSLIAFVTWSQELPMHANLDDNCMEAYSRLRAQGFDPSRFGLDECRIILNAIAPTVKKKLAAEFKAGSKLITQEDVVWRLRQWDVSVPFFVYTGKLDFFGQTASMPTFLEATDVVQHQEFPGSGHSGWSFEPAVWQNLIESE